MNNTLCYCPAYAIPHSPACTDCEARFFQMALADTGYRVDADTAVRYVESEGSWESAVKVYLGEGNAMEEALTLAERNR